MILIVEDSTLQAKVIADLLAENHMESEVATTGAQALEKASENRFSLILLDMVLPDTSGLNLLTQLKYSTATKNLRVIILSGLTDKNNMVEALGRGVNDYITKPYHPQELITRISNQLALQQSLQELHQLGAAKRQISSILSDEPNNPLNTLIGLTDALILEDLSMEEMKQNLASVNASAKNLKELLQNV